jgi:hypothetical protein
VVWLITATAAFNTYQFARPRASPTPALNPPSFNNRRLLGPIDNIPPAEAEDRYYATAQCQEIALAA